ncbi:hypothetical protein LSPH26S_03823 [Lysinibacillus sphaericus]
MPTPAGRRQHHQLSTVLRAACEGAQAHAVAGLRQGEDGRRDRVARRAGWLRRRPRPATSAGRRRPAPEAVRRMRSCPVPPATAGAQRVHGRCEARALPGEHSSSSRSAPLPSTRIGNAPAPAPVPAADRRAVWPGRIPAPHARCRCWGGRRTEFLVRREDAHAIARPGIGRRQQEGGFHQCGPAREALHRRGIPSFRADHHAQVVAAAR